MRCLKYRAQVSPGFASFSQQKDRSSHVSSLPWYPDGWSLACAEHPVPDDTKKVDFPAYHLWLLWYFMIVTVLAQKIYIYIWWSYMLQVAYCHIHLCAWVHMFMTYPYGPNVVDTLVGKPHLSAGGSEQKHHYQLPINHVQVITIFPQLKHRYQIIHQPSCINHTMWGPPVMFVGL